MEKSRDISGGRLLAQDLRRLGIKDEKVLAAIGRVPRYEFLARSLAERARDNDALPIGHGQTTSQPWVIARMLELAQLDAKSSKVLEIGTGCGYQTAILTHLAKEVYSLERIGQLLGEARKKLKELSYTKPRMAHRDGMKGLPEAMPYDAIIVCAAARQVPQALLDQLAPGGRLIIPQNSDDAEKLMVYTNEGQTEHDDVMFVPLIEGLS